MESLTVKDIHEIALLQRETFEVIHYGTYLESVRLNADGDNSYNTPSMFSYLNPLFVIKRFEDWNRQGMMVNKLIKTIEFTQFVLPYVSSYAYG
eukprot:CAMPEP_0168345020 /NCGR_PEP_ID=MMETSP0213-20121227/17258_1 /TAXON_ID=151035 /ORGANISM="Euplotes harpa, Strain FSP1.4" /LENGTH=93 /DNA_ID=CAMNT_0008353063 /DNA_START=86 /DNA_END=364 /DNA_ORIENTATION=+